MLSGAIHGDFNDHNTIVRHRPEATNSADTTPVYHIVGVIDFGDASYSYYVFDIAITIMYLSLESTSIEPLRVGVHVLEGYQSVRHLTPVEKSVLKFCVAARCVCLYRLGPGVCGTGGGGGGGGGTKTPASISVRTLKVYTIFDFRFQIFQGDPEHDPPPPPSGSACDYYVVKTSFMIQTC